MSSPATAPAPVAARLRAPSWRDPRLVVGLLLVLGSVLAGAWVVARADDTVPVWAAAATLAPGDPVDDGALTVVRARVEPGEDAYLLADRALPTDLVALRTVGPGELVPRSAVGEAAALDRKPVGLPYEGALPQGLRKGAQVDVWVSEPDPERAGAFLEPEQLAEGADVAEVATADTAFGPTGGGATVQVLLPADELRDALAALAAGAEVSLVLVPGSSPPAG